MGRKSSSVNKESKRYSACEAPVLLVWATRRALPHRFLCAATRHQKQQFGDKHGSFSSALHGDVINSIKHSRKIDLQFYMYYMEIISRSVVKAMCPQEPYVCTIFFLIIFKTKIEVHLFKFRCINKNEKGTK